MKVDYTSDSHLNPEGDDSASVLLDEKCQLFTAETGLHTSFYPEVNDSPHGLLTICKPIDSIQVSGTDAGTSELTTKLIPITVEELSLIIKFLEDLQAKSNFVIRQRPSDINIQGKLPLLLSYDVIPVPSVLIGTIDKRPRIQ